MSARGKFITVEGIDGAGKSSHLAQLAVLVREAGFEEVVTREPGGTPLGEKVRAIVLAETMDPQAEALLMFAARREHVVRVIEPALLAGRWVISDRFSDATYAYQCGGRGLAPEVLAALESVVHPGLQPDATFLFDVDPAIAAERSRVRSSGPDKFEREHAEFFRRVREAYLERARATPKRFHVIDAAGSMVEVRERVLKAFARAFR